MRNALLASIVVVGLAGAAGLALAQNGANELAAPERAQHGLFRADANNDGVLTRQEFDAGRDAMFAARDADSNGALTGEEMHRRGDHRGEGGHGGERMWDRADANNDGSVSRDEFLSGPIARFDRMDLNDDGVISADERQQRREGRTGERGRHADANNHRQISQAEFAAAGAAMFDRLDANDDGQVTREEAMAGRHGRRGHR